MFKKLTAILLTVIMTVGMATTVFAAENVTISTDTNGDKVPDACYVIPGVLATSVLKYDGTITPKAMENGNDWLTELPSTVTVYDVPVNTVIDISGLVSSRLEKLELKNGTLHVSDSLKDDDYTYKVSDYEGELGLEFAKGSYVKFPKGDLYIAFTAIPRSPVDQRAPAHSVLHVVAADGTSTTPPAQKPAETDKATDTTKPVTPPPATTETATGGTTYTIRSGDTFGKLSLNFYGDMKYHKELYAYNAAAMKKSNGELYVGQQLVIPAEIVKGVYTIAQPTLGTGEKLYTVKAGDTLGTIATTELGKINRYSEIFNRNSDRIENTNTIYEGQVIVIPAK